MSGIFVQQRSCAWKRLFALFCMLGVASTARAISTTTVHVREFPVSASVYVQALPRASEVRFPQDLVKDAANLQSAPSVPHVPEVSGIAALGALSDIGAYLRNYAAFVAAEKIVNGTSFPNLPSNVQQPLKSEFVSRENERNRMLSEADWVDDQANNRLGSWKERLDVQLGKLETETRAYDGERVQHQSQCSPAPDESTYDWCKKDHARLDIWLQSLKKRGDAYNIEHEQFLAEVRPYNSRLKTLLDLIKTWENGVLDLVRRLNSALNDTGTCTKEQHRRLQNKVNEFCKASNSCKPQNLSCDELKGRLQLNLDCAAARDEINNVCYGGGDDAHRGEADVARGRAAKCQARIAAECGGVGFTRERP